MGRPIRKFVHLSLNRRLDLFLSILEAIVVDTGVTPKDIVGFERFEEDLAELFGFPQRIAGFLSHVESYWH